MDRELFIAVFEKATEGGYTINFPDLPGCITEGDSLEEGMANAKEALELHLYGIEEDGEEIPESTLAEKIVVKDGQFTVPIVAYMDVIRDEMENRAVKKTVTLPRWLKRVAEENNINFSAVLQESLKVKLGIEEVRKYRQ